MTLAIQQRHPNGSLIKNGSNSLLKLSRNLVNGDGVEALNLELNKN
jgi:hypothetical protein